MIKSKNLDPEAGRWYVKRLVAQDAVQNVLQNPTGKPCIITRCVLHIITETATGGTTADIGVNATSATTNDSLLDGVAVTTAGVFDNIINKGSNGKEIKLLPAGNYVTADLSGAASGLIADVYVQLKQLNAA